VISKLISALRAVDADLDWRDLADILWLLSITRRGPHTEIPPGDDTPDAAQNAVVIDASPPAVQRERLTVSPDADPIPEPARPPGLQHAAPAEQGGRTLGVSVPASHALAGRLEIGRALRPLKRKRRSTRVHVFDTDATIDHYCNTRVLVPIMMPAGAPGSTMRQLSQTVVRRW
jgi:hypothetical protein